jgi:hypothetical protein
MGAFIRIEEKYWDSDSFKFWDCFDKSTSDDLNEVISCVENYITDIYKSNQTIENETRLQYPKYF